MDGGQVPRRARTHPASQDLRLDSALVCPLAAVVTGDCRLVIGIYTAGAVCACWRGAFGFPLLFVSSTDRRRTRTYLYNLQTASAGIIKIFKTMHAVHYCKIKKYYIIVLHIGVS